MYTPHMYNDVRAHIQEVLDIGAICKLHSPWANTVILVWKKDGSLRFCINLKKLNNWTGRTHTHYPASMKCLIACMALRGSLPLTWSQGTGRSRWMRKANHWLHSQWGCWASMSVKGCLSDSPMPPLHFRGWWRIVLGTSISIGASST